MRLNLITRRLLFRAEMAAAAALIRKLNTPEGSDETE